MCDKSTDSESDEEPIMSDPTVSAFLTQQLCVHGGRLAVSEIPKHLCLPPAHIASILREEASRFLLIEKAGVVLVLSSVRLCQNYLREQCQARDCVRLHLCHFFILGKCFHRKQGNSCKFSHDVQSEVNKAVLKANKINNLDEKDLQVLLLLNDPSCLPEICKDYKGEQNVESCPKGVQCSKLHVCGFFARGQCSHFNCRRSHNLLSQHTLQVMQARGLSMEMSRNIQLMRMHQCSQAQKEFRKNNIKGNSHSTANASSTRKMQQARNLDMGVPVRPLPLLSLPMFSETAAPSTGFLLMNRPVIQMPPGYIHPLFPPANRYPTFGAPPNTANVPRPVSGPSTAHRTTTNFTGALHPNKPVERMPVYSSPAPPAISTARQATTNFTGGLQSNKPVVSVGPSPASPATSTAPPATTRFTGAQQSNKPVVSVGPSPASTATSTAHQATTPFTRALQSNKPLELGLFPHTTTAKYTRQPGISACTGFQPPDKAVDRPTLTSTSTALMPTPHRSSFVLELPVELPAEIKATNASNDLQKKVSLMDSSQKDPGDPNEICLYHIWKYCKNQKKCAQMHYIMPYRWQMLEATGEWKDIPSMEEIEKAYSDPNSTSSKHHYIDFQTMTTSFSHVRRLSTASSVTKPADYILTTKWIWYWKDENGQCIEYGKHGAKVSSSDLESVYLADKTGVLQFQGGPPKYEIYEIQFQDMIEMNLLEGTKKEVLRRPTFVSQEDVRNLKANGKDPQAATATIALPAYWDPNAMPSLGYKLVDIPRSSSEFRKIQSKFEKTMARYSLQHMKRIQNPSLWQVYQMQMKKMKTMSRQEDVLEKKLFHGTDACHVDTICRENFDWRLYGGRPMDHGDGSYFTRDASASHQYCRSSTSSKTMFLARVLVGDFVMGHAGYTCPPAKRTIPSQSYDSCVDNERDPSIFIIFEKHQTYPDYILEYTEDKTPSSVQNYVYPTAKDKTQSNAVQDMTQTMDLDFAWAKVQDNTRGDAKGKEKDKCCIS